MQRHNHMAKSTFWTLNYTTKYNFHHNLINICIAYSTASNWVWWNRPFGHLFCVQNVSFYSNLGKPQVTKNIIELFKLLECSVYDNNKEWLKIFQFVYFDISTNSYNVWHRTVHCAVQMQRTQLFRAWSIDFVYYVIWNM